jgi:hypothetical protein
MALSISPLASCKAFLQSIMPWPDIFRSFTTVAADISTISPTPCSGSQGPVQAGAAHPAGSGPFLVVWILPYFGFDFWLSPSALQG